MLSRRGKRMIAHTVPVRLIFPCPAHAAASRPLPLSPRGRGWRRATARRRVRGTARVATEAPSPASGRWPSAPSPTRGEGRERRRLPAHRATFQVVVSSPVAGSLASISAMPLATSSSRMRSDSAKFLALRAARRARDQAASMSASSMPPQRLQAPPPRESVLATPRTARGRSRGRRDCGASSSASAPCCGTRMRFRMACSSVIIFGVLRSSDERGDHRRRRLRRLRPTQPVGTSRRACWRSRAALRRSSRSAGGNAS